MKANIAKMVKEAEKQYIESTGFASHFTSEMVPAVFLEKFAALIVKECASIASNADLEDVEGGDSAVLRAASEQIEAKLL